MNLFIDGVICKFLSMKILIYAPNNVSTKMFAFYSIINYFSSSELFFIFLKLKSINFIFSELDKSARNKLRDYLLI